MCQAAELGVALVMEWGAPGDDRADSPLHHLPVICATLSAAAPEAKPGHWPCSGGWSRLGSS